MLNVNEILNNPQAFMKQLQGNNALMSNPMVKNAIGIVQNGNMQGLQALGENICKSNGKDFNTEFTNFKKMLGIH